MKKTVNKIIIILMILSLSTPLWGGGRGISLKKVVVGKAAKKAPVASCRVTIRIPQGIGIRFSNNNIKQIYILKNPVYHQKTSQSISYFYKRIWTE